MPILSRRSFFRILPSAPAAAVAAVTPSFDEQMADAIAEIDATPVLAPPKSPHADARERLRVLLDGRYLGRADRRYVSPEEIAEYKALQRHFEGQLAKLRAARAAGSDTGSHQEASAECISSPDTAATFPASEGAA